MPAAQVPAPLVALTHVPLLHVSPVGQTFPQEPQLLVVVSSVHVPLQQIPPVQEVPSAFVGFVQTPVVGSHVPASWHSSRGVHVTEVPAQDPSAWQTSLVVQALPSLHGAPTLIVVPQAPLGEQTAERQEPAGQSLALAHRWQIRRVGLSCTQRLVTQSLSSLQELPGERLREAAAASPIPAAARATPTAPPASDLSMSRRERPEPRARVNRSNRGGSIADPRPKAKRRSSSERTHGSIHGMRPSANGANVLLRNLKRLHAPH